MHRLHRTRIVCNRSVFGAPLTPAVLTPSLTRVLAHSRSVATQTTPSPPPPPLTPIERIQKDLAYCRQQVNLHDNDQYLCSLLLPPSARAGVHILRAFNLELSQVTARHSMPTVGIALEQDVLGEEAIVNAQQEAVKMLYEDHQPTEAELNMVRIGLMKLQWWRDGLETALENVDRLRFSGKMNPAVEANAAHAQPVLNMLAIACKQYKLSNQLIANMVEAREISLTEGQSPDLASLLDYAESTSSALLYLTLECLAVRNEYADRAASHIGKAMGIALTIRSLPYSASKKQVLIPKTIVRERNLDLATLLTGHNSPELAKCVEELANVAESHLQQARQFTKQVPKEARPALASASLCDLFLNRLRSHRFNVFDPSLGLLPTVSKDSADDPNKASTASVSLSGSSQGLQPLRLRLQLLKHRLMGTY